MRRDSQGLVYLPYLHEWNARTHNLLELCAHLSSVFGVEPPCFASRKPQQVCQPAAVQSIVRVARLVKGLFPASSTDSRPCATRSAPSLSQQCS